MDKKTYRDSLRAAEAELAGLEERRAALEATVSALRRLLGDEQSSLGATVLAGENTASSPKPQIPLRFFHGMTATQGYRALLERWPGEYTAPEIREAFIAGGMEHKSRRALLGQIHSVLLRERRRLAKLAEAK